MEKKTVIYENVNKNPFMNKAETNIFAEVPTLPSSIFYHKLIYYTSFSALSLLKSVGSVLIFELKCVD